jgi:hypothetical protein
MNGIKNIEVNITDLFVNSSNPRFDAVENQAESFAAMIDEQKDKLIALGEHIVNYGLNPLEKILISKIDGKYVVREGNRRITVLKFLNNPELIPSKYSKLKNKFVVLSKEIDENLLKRIPCVLSNDEKVINEWISLKHTGENNGAGTVRWNAQQTERFRIQTTDITRKFFLDELKDSDAISDTIKVKLHLIKKTNFERIVGDPDIRTYLGIAYTNGVFSLYNGFVTPQLILVLEDLINGMSVGKIYAKKDRQEYIETVKQRLASSSETFSKNDANANIHNIIANRNNNGNTDDDTHSGYGYKTNGARNNTGQSYPLNRKSLIPYKTNIAVSNARIRHIYMELKSLEIGHYPNAVAVLFRVFVELSVDVYIESHSLSVKKDAKLHQKITAVKNYFIANTIMTENELHPIEMMVAQPTASSSVRTFNQFVHNSSVTPTVDDLKNSWDDLYPFIENLWK